MIDVIHNIQDVRILEVYDHTDYIQRRSHWMDLVQVSTVNIMWDLIGDFTVIFGAHEKREVIFHLGFILRCLMLS